MDLTSFITELGTNQSLVTYNEDSIKQTVVLPIFQLLGWNIFSVREVTPEYSLQSKRVDYALLIDEKPMVFVEVKRPSVALDDCQEQLLAYSFHAGVGLAVLTNGVNWWFYLPLQEGHWENRKYFSINVIDQNPNESAERFEDFLNKNNVVSGEAQNSAKQVLKGKARTKGIASGLPKAWKALIAEPDEQLIELLKDKVEDISGYTPTPEELMAFIANIPEISQDAQPHDQERAPATPDKVKKRDTPQNRSRNQNASGIVGQEEMFYEILKLLQTLGKPVSKRRVENDIFEKNKSEFMKEWYQEPVSHGIPRWRHNIAWAKERLKHEGLIKRKEESGRGIWELTELGKKKEIQ